MANQKDCNRVIVIDSEIKRLDNLDYIYREKLKEIASKKSILMSEKNDIIRSGHCVPIARDKIDSLSGKKIGIEYSHADYCKKKTTKLEV